MTTCTRLRALMLALLGFALPIATMPVVEASAPPTTGTALVEPFLQAHVRRSAPDHLVDILVVMRAQADLGRVRSQNRADRLALVEGSLRTTAATGQRGILDFLRARERERQATGIVPLWISDEVAVRATPAVVRALARRADVREIRPDLTFAAPPRSSVPPRSSAPPRPGSVRTATSSSSTATIGAVATEPNLSQVNAPELWQRGFTGQGVVVASMDTGVDLAHPDLTSRWRGGANSWFDPSGEHTTPTDVSGHGTQTMGVLVGGGAGGSAIGVAPGARWIAVKIFNDRGVATTARIHQGYQWLLDPDGNPATADAPEVVNNSWSGAAAGCSLEFQPDLHSLRAAGIVPVFAAGNAGPQSGTVFSPANLPEAFTVGGVDAANLLDPFSSRGPSACLGVQSPTVVAPDVGVRTTDLYGSYTAATGTSLAAPHLSGAVALLLSAFPLSSSDRLQAALISGAVDRGPTGPDNDYGTGLLDVLAAYGWMQSSPDFTMALGPTSATAVPGGQATFTVTVTGSGGFDGPVAFSLTGLPPGQSTWAFLPAAIPTGAGSSQLVLTTAATIPAGSYPVTVTGTSGMIVRTATPTLVVSPPVPADFTLGVTPGVVNVVPGAVAAAALAIGSMNGFSQEVALVATGLPASVGSSVITEPVIFAAGSTRLVISTLASAPAGSYPVTVTGTAAGLSHSVELILLVGNFTVTPSPAAVTVARGRSATYTVTVGTQFGFTGTVALTRSGLPAGSTTTWSGNPVSAPGRATLTVRTTASTKRGTFAIRITGTGGGLAHSATVTLVVG